MGNAGRVLMIPKGDYNAATTYEMLDCVYYNGRSYVCKQTSTGNAPTNTTYWQVMTPDSSAEIQALTNQLTDEVTTRSALGAKNLLPLDLANCKTRNTSGTWSGNAYTISGVTFTVNEDNTINVNGTSAAEIEFKLGIYAKTDNITTGCIVSNGDAGVSGNWLSTLQYRSDSSFISQDNFISDKVITVPSNCTNIEFTIYINPNKTLSNVVFKPMIRLASDAGTTYQPYAKTNVELTQELPQIESGTTAFTDGNEKVNFSKAFSTAPNVIAIPKYTTVTTGETPLLLKVYDVTTTYFRVRAIDNTGANVSTFTNATSFMWQAMS